MWFLACSYGMFNNFSKSNKHELTQDNVIHHLMIITKPTCLKLYYGIAEAGHLGQIYLAQ